MGILVYNPIERPSRCANLRVGERLKAAPSPWGVIMVQGASGGTGSFDVQTILGILRRVAGAGGPPITLEVYPTVESTSAIALADAREALLVVALEQTGGRGRHGSSWASPLGGLYMSYVPPRHTLPDRMTDVPLLAALAVADAIDDVLNTLPGDLVQRTELKWPNDVLLMGGKLAGVLVQSRQIPDEPSGGRPRVVIGVGVNANADVVLPPVTPSPSMGEESLPPVSLRGFLESEVDLQSLLVEVVRNLVRRLAEGLDEVAVSEYASRCATLGMFVAFTEGGHRTRGRALSVTREGALLVELEDGERRHISSGEVHHLRRVVP